MATPRCRAAPEPGVEAPTPADPDALPEADAAGGDGALDVDHDGEDFHQDSAVDRMGGADGGLGLDGIAIAGAGEGPDFDAFAGDDPSLHEHLRRQAGEILSGADLLIAEQLIDRIDETGYFLGQPAEIAQRLGVPLAEVERILAIDPDLRSRRRRRAQPRRMPRAAGEGRRPLRSGDGAADRQSRLSRQGQSRAR